MTSTCFLQNCLVAAAAALRSSNLAIN
uniref:Uncharacterized protein n=1 Tax=Anguilla anguilla TaxID=7936 RepID=A0A0E9QKR2_ANGAN